MEQEKHDAAWKTLCVVSNNVVINTLSWNCVLIAFVDIHPLHKRVFYIFAKGANKLN